MFRTGKETIVVTITADNRSFVERVVESRSKVHHRPEFYRDVQFVLDSKESMEAYREHFIYQYLSSLSRAADIPGFILRADKLVITVKKEQ